MTDNNRVEMSEDLLLGMIYPLVKAAVQELEDLGLRTEENSRYVIAAALCAAFAAGRYTHNPDARLAIYSRLTDILNDILMS